MNAPSEKHREIISPFEYRKKRLDTFLANSKDFQELIGKELSRSRIAFGIRNGGVRIKNVSAKPSCTLSAHETLVILPEKFETQEKPLLPEPDLRIAIVKENQHFLVIDKPTGIQVHPSATQISGTVANWIVAHHPEMKRVGDSARPGIVHRLDKDTSGLLLLAKTNRAFTALKKLFRERRIRKRYLALVFGVPKTKDGVIATPIARSTRGDRQAAAPPGKRVKGIIRSAETHYRVLETFGDAALVEAEPKTGRTHQIRVHLASIGHPVLGDALYGSKESKKLFPEMHRHFLHATSLSFSLFGKDFDFESPLPKNFEDALTLYKHRHLE